MALSPDGRYLAYTTTGSGGERLYVRRMDSTESSMVPGGEGGRYSFWSPDSRQIGFFAGRTVKKTAISGGDPITLCSHTGNPAGGDGKLLAFERVAAANGGDLWTASLDGSGKLEPLLSGQAFLHPRISPDSRFFAYSSTETGRREVYIQTLPPGGGKWQVSTGSGSEPKWRGDGKELYFLSGNKVMAAAISFRGAAVEIGEIKPLFQARRGTGAAGHFAASPDGKLFALSLVNERAQDRPITLLLNGKLP